MGITHFEGICGINIYSQFEVFKLGTSSGSLLASGAEGEKNERVERRGPAEQKGQKKPILAILYHPSYRVIENIQNHQHFSR